MNTFDIIISAYRVDETKDTNNRLHYELAESLIEWDAVGKIVETSGAYHGTVEPCFIATVQDTLENRAEVEGLLFLYRQESLILRDTRGIHLVFGDGTTHTAKGATWSNTYKYFQSYVKEGDGYWQYIF